MINWTCPFFTASFTPTHLSGSWATSDASNTVGIREDTKSTWGNLTGRAALKSVGENPKLSDKLNLFPFLEGLCSKPQATKQLFAKGYHVKFPWRSSNALLQGNMIKPAIAIDIDELLHEPTHPCNRWLSQEIASCYHWSNTSHPWWTMIRPLGLSGKAWLPFLPTRFSSQPPGPGGNPGSWDAVEPGFVCCAWPG